MKVEYATKNGKFKVEFEAENQQDLWKQLAQFQEIFEDLTCTKKIDDKYLKSDNVRFVVRTNTDGDEFFELHCVEPGPLFGTKKSFGCFKEKDKKGNLFPHRKDKEGNFLPDNGWMKWDKTLNKEV